MRILAISGSLRIGSHNFTGCHAFFQNGFAVGIVIIRHGQNQRSSHQVRVAVQHAACMDG